MKKLWNLLIAGMLALLLVGCSSYGEVEQGRVVAFNKDTMEVTFIKDTTTDDMHPHHDALPALVMKMPLDPNEIGPWPEVGLRMILDLEQHLIVMYNPETESFDKLPFEVVSRHDNVDARKRHPLVYDATTEQMRKFPVVNSEERTVTVYSSRQKVLTTIRLAAEDFNRYDEADWAAGDEVRVYFHVDEQDQMRRFMNLTKTDFSKK